MISFLPVKRLASVALGKMVQPESKGPTDVQAPYLRAAHVQPNGRIIDLPAQPMWFSRSELKWLDLRRDDVVIVEGGAGYGRSAVLREDLPGWGFQNSIIRLRPFLDRSDGRFIDYALQEALVSGRVDLVTSIATLPHFTADKVSKFVVPSPALDEQRAIADYLDQETAQIDHLVARQEELIGYLRERRRAVLDEVTFGTNGDPVRLRFLFSPSSEANHPSEEVLSVYRDYGVVVKTSRSDNFNRTPENVARYLLVRPGDLVVNRMKAWQGSLGISEHRGIVSGDYEVARPVGNMLIARFAHLFLRSPRMIAEYAVRSTGIRPSQWRLYWDQMGDIPVPVPPIDLQRKVISETDKQLDGIDSLVDKAQEHITLAKERRSALISAAVTGQFDVRTARKVG